MTTFDPATANNIAQRIVDTWHAHGQHAAGELVRDLTCARETFVKHPRQFKWRGHAYDTAADMIAQMADAHGGGVVTLGDSELHVALPKMSWEPVTRVNVYDVARYDQETGETVTAIVEVCDVPKRKGVER